MAEGLRLKREVKYNNANKISCKNQIILNSLNISHHVV
jgi:hypothetical protein